MTPDVQALVDRAYATRRAGDAAAALTLYGEAADASDANAAGRAHCLRHVGDLARELGRDDAARAALTEAERLYRGPVSDTLSLANTLRLRALLDGGAARWQEARRLYEQAGAETGLDLAPALAECDRRLAGGDADAAGD